MSIVMRPVMDDMKITATRRCSTGVLESFIPPLVNDVGCATKIFAADHNKLSRILRNFSSVNGGCHADETQEEPQAQKQAG
jgi:hypothetical protein